MKRIQCSFEEQNLQKCNCSYPGCEKKGNCCQCMHYHRMRRELPACFFPDHVERTYDRSFEKFIAVYS